MTGAARIDLLSLELLADAARLGSVSRAAASHGLSQPSASARIGSLERALGLSLLERTPAGSHPTEAGRVVIASAERVLAALEDLAAEAAAVREAASSRLRVVASYTVAEHLLPEWVRQFRESAAWRGIEIEVEVANSTDVGSRVRAGRAAVGFVESPEPPLGLSSAIVGHDELVVVVPPTHPWAARRRPLGPSSLAATGLVVRERGSGTRESFEVALAAALGPGSGPPVAPVSFGSTAAVKEAVLSGFGPGVVSRLAVAGEIARGNLVPVRLVGIDLRRVLRMVWPVSPARTGPAAALVEFVLRATSLAGAEAPAGP